MATPAKRHYRECPVCGCTLRESNYTKHLNSQHSESAEQEGEQLVRCTLCSREVKKKNLKKHMRRIHEGVKSRPYSEHERFHIDRYYNDSKMTSDEARKQLDALKDNNLVSDKVISAYLRAHPNPEVMGKFGVPQDKYRWGFYGSRTMEYDSWGRIHKQKEK
jgi:uncharacterized C2H2 Zn-finger protein